MFAPDGALLPDAEAVLELVRDHNMVLATGHLSPEEVDRFTTRALQIGCKKIVSTHPDLPLIAMPVELQKRLAERGVFFERTFNVTRPPYSRLSTAELAARIREVGPASTILATDFGQPANPSPVEGMRTYAEAMAANGFTASEIRAMSGEHARALLEV